MKTYKIKSQKDLDKFKDEYGYKIDGNAEFSYSANFTGRLYVEGSLSIKAGWYIEAGESIEAGGSYGISAGLSITAKGTLSFGLNAYAGIKTWGKATEAEKTITCSKLLKGNIEYGNLVETGEPKEEKITIKISKSSLQALKDSGIEVIND